MKRMKSGLYFVLFLGWIMPVVSGCGQDRQAVWDAHHLANVTDDETFYGAVAVAEAGQYATAGRRLMAGEKVTDVLGGYRQANLTLRTLVAAHEKNKIRRAMEALYIDSQKSIADLIRQDYERAEGTVLREGAKK
jgi:hypothetical protein